MDKLIYGAFTTTAKPWQNLGKTLESSSIATQPPGCCAVGHYHRNVQFGISSYDEQLNLTQELVTMPFIQHRYRFGS